MTDKTMVDVADKALDRLSGGTEALAAAIGRIAPDAWNAMVHQQRVYGWALLVTLAVAAVASGFAFRSFAARYRAPRLDKDYEIRSHASDVLGPCTTVAGLLFAASLVLAAFLAPTAVSRISAPEAYAIEAIGDLVSPKGASVPK